MNSISTLRFGYIYVRDNDCFRLFHVYKWGITRNPIERENGYITCEPVKGQYVLVIAIPYDKLKQIDILLKDHLREHHVYNEGGGTEFYKRCIISMFEPFLASLNISFKVLTQNDIANIERQSRAKTEKSVTNAVPYPIDVSNARVALMITPSTHQQEILHNIGEFYQYNDIGKLIWACGLGKALVSLLIIRELQFKSIIIGVPSTCLQTQFAKEILRLFPNKSRILFLGSNTSTDITSTTNPNSISSFLERMRQSDEPAFIVTTYHSCHLLVDKTMHFCFKIGDEAHHLTGSMNDDEQGFCAFHQIQSKKTLFMTATEKIVSSKKGLETYSMDNTDLFGNYIDKKSTHWAIENKKITDYNVLLLKNTEKQIDTIIRLSEIDVINKELFLAAYMTVKSLETYSEKLTHVLVYTNTTDDADLVKRYIDVILNLNITAICGPDIYNNSLHSRDSKNLPQELSQFNAAKFGIISCVYIFGEGVDLPKLNGVCIAANMQSEIRIVQYLLRPNRLEFGNPDKIAHIIIPYIDNNDFTRDDKSYQKVRDIILQLRNIDETIEQKMVVSKLVEKEEEEVEEAADDETKSTDFVLNDDCFETNALKIRLRHSKALDSKLSEEQDEYNHIKEINRSLKIQSKEDYANSRDKTECYYIDDPVAYFKAKGVWTNWYDFIGTDTSAFIQHKHEWSSFCKEKNIETLDAYYMLCRQITHLLPQNPGDFYVDFTNIPSELGFNRGRRR